MQPKPGEAKQVVYRFDGNTVLSEFLDDLIGEIPNPSKKGT